MTTTTEPVPGHPMQTRLSLDPLLARVPDRLDTVDADGRTHERRRASLLAEAVGVDVRRVYRWLEEGGIPYYSADAAAAALGLHPRQLWPDFHDTPDYQHGYVHWSIREPERTTP